jgi:hypothetical protein
LGNERVYRPFQPTGSPNMYEVLGERKD